MCTSASLHRDHTSWLSGEEWQELGTGQFLPEGDAAIDVGAMRMEDAFGQIDADDCDVAHILPPLGRSPTCCRQCATP